MPSSLKLITGQSVVFGHSADTCANNDNRAYCKLVHDGDPISFEVKRTRGTSLGCSLTDVSINNEALNPNFTASSAPWTLTGGWTWNGAGYIFDTASNGSATQGMIGMVNGALYQIKVTTLITTSGDDLNILLSGNVIGVIPDGSPAGTYYFIGIAHTGTSTFGVGATSGGSTLTTRVDSIFAYRAGECLAFDTTLGTITYDPLLGFVVNGTVIITATLPFETSSTYSVKSTISVEQFQSGQVQFGYDTDTSPVLDGSNGEMSWTNNGSILTTLAITLTDFTGVITAISFEQLSSDYYFSLNTLDGTFVGSLNTFATYCREWIKIFFDPLAEGFSHGCYRIGLYDPFLHDDHITFDYNFLTLGAPWTIASGAVWTLTGGTGYEYDSASPNGDINTSEVVAPFYAAWTKLLFETGTLSGAGVGTLSVGATLASSPDTVSGFFVTALSDTIYRNASEGYPPFLYASLSNRVEPHITITGTTAADHIEIKNASYKVYPYHQDYLSNCINFSEVIPCSKLILGVTDNNQGFNGSNCGFSLIQRFRIVRITPVYKITGVDFIASDSTRRLISGSGQKFYTLLFDYMDEVAHDVVQSLILCKAFYIADEYSANLTVTAKRYFALPQDYNPEWDKDGKLNLAMGRILIMEYDQVKFTTNCE